MLHQLYDKKAIGFSAPGKPEKWEYFHKPCRVPKVKLGLDGDISTICKREADNKEIQVPRDWEGFLLDNLIIHPREIFDSEKTIKLYEQKELLGAEVGWWQTLSDNDNKHECIWGGVLAKHYFVQFIHQKRFKDCR